MAKKNFTLTLTDMEFRSLREAVRIAQVEHEDMYGRLDPVLSRIQIKLGEEPHT